MGKTKPHTRLKAIDEVTASYNSDSGITPGEGGDFSKADLLQCCSKGFEDGAARGYWKSYLYPPTTILIAENSGITTTYSSTYPTIAFPVPTKTFYMLVYTYTETDVAGDTGGNVALFKSYSGFTYESYSTVMSPKTGNIGRTAVHLLHVTAERAGGEITMQLLDEIENDPKHQIFIYGFFNCRNAFNLLSKSYYYSNTAGDNMQALPFTVDAGDWTYVALVFVKAVSDMSNINTNFFAMLFDDISRPTDPIVADIDPVTAREIVCYRTFNINDSAVGFFGIARLRSTVAQSITVSMETLSGTSNAELAWAEEITSSGVIQNASEGLDKSGIYDTILNDRYQPL